MLDCGKGKDDSALLAQFGYNAFYSGEYAGKDADTSAYRNLGVRLQKQPACQPLTNPAEFFIAYHIPQVITQNAKNAWT